jgi:hypothetical protein
MRASHLIIISLLGAGVLGCGGGSPSRPDAPPPVDAFACSQSGTLNIAAALDFSGGQAQGAVPTTGTQLQVSIIVTSSSQPDRGFFIIQANNGGLFSSATGKAGRFEQPPTPGSYPMDSDASLGFGMDFVDGVTHNGNGTASANPRQVALLDMTAGGTVRIDSFTPAAMPGMTTTIGATITNAKFKGFNVLSTGALDTAGNGCDITVQNLAFTGLSVKWQAAAFPPIIEPPPAQPELAARPDLAARGIEDAAARSADFRIE